MAAEKGNRPTVFISQSAQQHPLSAAFPAMQPDEYQALCDSIIEIGVRNPITLFEGMVLDGWHRYKAATECGMACPFVELGDVDPKDFVIAQNKARRHITLAQLVACVSSVYQWKPQGGNQTALSAVCSTSKEVAEKTGASVRTVEQYRQVERKASPEVIEAVKRGEVGLPKAAAIAKLPMAEQAAALHKPAPKPAKPASVVEPAHEAPPDYSELDAAREQISDLQNDLVVARMGNASEEEKQQAAALIAELRHEVKTLTATLKAACLSRDSLMEENTQMKRQMAMHKKEIDKRKASK